MKLGDIFKINKQQEEPKPAPHFMDEAWSKMDNEAKDELAKVLASYLQSNNNENTPSPQQETPANNTQEQPKVEENKPIIFSAAPPANNNVPQQSFQAKLNNMSQYEYEKNHVEIKEEFTQLMDKAMKDANGDIDLFLKTEV